VTSDVHGYINLVSVDRA